MKKISLTFIAIAFAINFSYAQTNTFPSSGNVGVGTTSPGNNLGFLNVNSDTGSSGITWYNPAPFDYGIYRTAGSWTGPNYQQMALQWDTGILLNPGSLYGKSYVEIAGGGLRVTSGNVGIGTTDTKGYTFAVNGTAIATSMTVKLYSAWPDYVFQPAYHLQSLTDVKTYIDQNHHLPDMPTEQEVATNGINLGEMVKLQTKKIEELTLYLIELKKENETLKQAQKTINQKLKLHHIN